MVKDTYLIDLGEGWLPDIENCFLVAQQAKAILVNQWRWNNNEDITLRTVLYLLIALFISICMFL